MAERILVYIPQMQETITKYNAAKGSLSDAIVAMQSAVNSVEWTGEASKAFKDEFDQLVEKLKKSDDIMQDAVSDLNNTINTMQAAEESAASTGRTLEKGSVAIPI